MLSGEPAGGYLKGNLFFAAGNPLRADFAEAIARMEAAGNLVGRMDIELASHRGNSLVPRKGEEVIVERRAQALPLLRQ